MTSEDNDLKAILPIHAISSVSANFPDHTLNHEHQKKHHSVPRLARDFFETLKKAVEESNNKLQKQNIPFFLTVYLQDDEVFLEIARRNAQGSVVSVEKRNIGQMDFVSIINEITSFEGLILDTDG